MALIPSLKKPSAPAVSTKDSAKGKTKARQRYLKAKKTRAKNKGASVPKAKTLTNVAVISRSNAEETSSTSENNESDGDETFATPTPMMVDPEPTQSAASATPMLKEKALVLETKHRPQTKKRKLSPPRASSSSPSTSSSTSSSSSSASSSSSRSPSPVRNFPLPQPTDEDLPALPRFPLPRQPALPSASVLYLQGVDDALIEAEVVDSSRTLSLSGVEGDDSGLGLSEKTKKRLGELGIDELFAVQTAILPFLLSPSSAEKGGAQGIPSHRALYLPYHSTRDVCVSAPTGSGKTLAYVLPIIEVLTPRIVIRLRALVVLPTRDLVSQVRETFEVLCKGRNLKIGMATGQHSFAHEQAQLVGEVDSTLEGGHSKVDILVCTPGRLMDHLNGTPGFSLQHLRFLVIDEADRLVTEAFNDWLARVLAALRTSAHPSSAPMDSTPSSTAAQSTPHNSLTSSVPRHQALHPAWLSASSPQYSALSSLSPPPSASCQKLLFSATLTRDPSRLAALELRDPKYFVVGSEASTNPSKDDDTEETGIAGERFAFPAGLREHMLVCEGARKPLFLLSLVHSRGVGVSSRTGDGGEGGALVFTKSAESTARLVKVVNAFEESFWGGEGQSMEIDGAEKRRVVAEAYSSDLSAAQRKSILGRFKKGEIGMLVCSDLISRGIDISHVAHVVSYDAPIDVRKYVHRVGRTARAGREGDAWTLIEEQEARHFKKMMSEASHLDRIEKVKVSDKALEPFQPHYETALKELRAAFGR